MKSPIAVAGSKVKLIEDIGIEPLNQLIKKNNLKKGNIYTVSGVLVSEDGTIFYQLLEAESKTQKPIGLSSHRFEIVESVTLKDFTRYHKQT